MQQIMQRGRRLVLVLSAAALAVAGCERAPGADVASAALIELSDQFTGEYALTGLDGSTVTPATFKGRVAIVYFGFASCPDVCPLALSRLAGALNELSPAEAAEVAPLFITVDPERDDASAMRAFLAFDPRLVGLTGAPEAVKGAAVAFKVYANRVDIDGSALGYTMDHSSLFYLVDRAGAPRYALRDNLSPEEMAAAIRLMLKRKT